MLTSLFGDLGPARGTDEFKRASEAPDQGFAATAILETVATEVNARGQMVDRHSQDLVVTGSPAQAIRDHFSSTRADLETANALITLLDPTGVWASAVIKALSDAGGRPIERLHLREHTTLRTLAMIERTTLARRQEEALRVVHADVRAPGAENAEIPIALMERSQMTTVIIGPMQPHAIDALLGVLLSATQLPTWRCPHVLFMLPPNAVWIGNKVSATPWPDHVQVHQLSESMTGASSVWNAMLGTWNQIKSRPGEPPAARFQVEFAEFAPSSPARLDLLPGPLAPSETDPWFSEGRSPGARVTARRAAMQAARGAVAPRPLSARRLDPAHAKLALAGMLATEGMLGCAVVDGATGLVIARESREDHPVDMDLVGASCAHVLRVHRASARGMGLSEHLDELITTAGPRQQLIRMLQRYTDTFLVVLLDKHRSNMSLARLQLMDVERRLA